MRANFELALADAKAPPTAIMAAINLKIAIFVFMVFGWFRCSFLDQIDILIICEYFSCSIAFHVFDDWIGLVE